MYRAIKLAGVLSAVLLLAVVAVGVEAQGGAPLNGFIWDGSCFLPEVAASVLPAASRWIPNGAPLNGFIWDGSCFLPEVAAFTLP